MLCHVDMLPAGEPPRLAGVTPPATGGVPGSRPTKNGMDYMLGLRLLCPIARHLVEDVLYRSDQRGVLAEPPRWRSRARIGFWTGFHHGVLPLILPVLTPL
ncbi:hypothetical protein TIFTF001_041499 [Ficus carica]|uniref:Uncharacterized protein n=1 Tax=Ficus carica TaxID=3494 RepID=A0AA87Z6Z6_FICCA|nr:hypothetical protein TIFTF001_041499 [Ficus carica]